MSEELDTHIAQTYIQISDAAKKADLPLIQKLTRKVSELVDLKQQQAAIHQRLVNLTKDEATDTFPQTAERNEGIIRELIIQIKAGMIRQNLLTLTPHIKRGIIKIGEELLIEALPSGERFTTVLMDKGNKLRARGQIARFYREASCPAR